QQSYPATAPPRRAPCFPYTTLFRSDARAEGMEASGPYPADTLMSRAAGGEFDCVVAMYHDQGHTPVKTLGFRYDDAKKAWTGMRERKSTRLNSSHDQTSYAVSCLKR